MMDVTGMGGSSWDDSNEHSDSDHYNEEDEIVKIAPVLDGESWQAEKQKMASSPNLEPPVSSSLTLGVADLN